MVNWILKLIVYLINLLIVGGPLLQFPCPWIGVRQMLITTIVTAIEVIALEKPIMVNISL